MRMVSPRSGKSLLENTKTPASRRKSSRTVTPINKKMTPLKTDSSAIKVVVRLRPMNSAEKAHGTLPVIKASTQDKTVTVIKGQGNRQVRSSFSFDHVFSAFSSQEEVFESTLEPVIRDIMQGYESTVFAYGQTGTGKTFTMEGELDDAIMQGVIPRSSNAIFEALSHPQYVESKVTCSYLEIYNEELSDLLVGEEDKKNAPKIDIMETKNGTICRGLVQKEVTSPGDVLALMQKAQNQRRIGETKMNKHSSRSHCVFTIRVNGTAQKIDGTFDFDGKLHLVDLAGSECAKTAGNGSSDSEGARERERMNINRSLLTLGRVLTLLEKQHLSKKNTNIRIPYRDSKLTRILQESLGGKCKTIVIATLSPSITALEESISTLNYAQSASSIVNKPVNSLYMSSSPTGISQSFSNSEKDLGNENGYSIEYWEDMQCRLQYMQAQVEEAQAALARKHLQQQEYVERAEKAEADKILLEDNLKAAAIKIDNLKGQITDEVERREKIQTQLKETESALKNTSAILEATQLTEKTLTKEAKILIETLKNSITDGDALHSTLLKHYKEDLARRLATREFRDISNEMLDKSLGLLSDLSSKSKRYLNDFTEVCNDNNEQGESALQDFSTIVNSISEKIQSLNTLLKNELNGESGIITHSNNTSTKVAEKIEKMMNIMNDGETHLSKLCTNAQDRLKTNATTLQQIGQLHAEKTSKSLVSLEANIHKSKSNISNMISSALKTLKDARHDRESIRSSHDNLINEWRDSSLQNSKGVEETANEESLTVKNSLQHFEGEMKYYDGMKQTLESQRTLVEREGQSHIDEVAQQQSDLIEQSNLIATVNEQRIQAQEIFMNNMINSFQTMIRAQMQQFAEEAEKSHAVIKKSNDGLQATNELLDKGAKCIVDNVDRSSKSLISNVQMVRANDDKMSEVIKGTKKRLDRIAITSSKHQEMVKGFSVKAEDSMSKLSSIEDASDQLFASMKENEGNCTKHLSEIVEKEAIAGYKEILEVGENMLNHCNENVISDCSSTFDEIMSPRKAMVEGVKNEMENVSLAISSGKDEIKQIAESLSRKGEESVVFVLDKEKSFGNKVKKRGEQMEATVEKISVNINNHLHLTTMSVSDSSVQIEVLKSQIENHSSNVLCCNEDVAKVESRNEWAYTEELSSTPSEDKILANFECSGAIFNDDTGSMSDTINVEKENVIVGHDSELTTSVESSSSLISPRSPVLVERSLNQDKVNRGSLSKVPRSSKKNITSGSVASKRSGSIRSSQTPNLKKPLVKKKNRAPTPTRGGGKRPRTST